MYGIGCVFLGDKVLAEDKIFGPISALPEFKRFVPNLRVIFRFVADKYLNLVGIFFTASRSKASPIHKVLPAFFHGFDKKSSQQSLYFEFIKSYKKQA